jgi:hypothetical protein
MEENRRKDSQQNTGEDSKSVPPVPANLTPVKPPQPVVPTQETSSQTAANPGENEEQAIVKTEKDMDKFERWILRATWAGVTAAAITGYFIHNQFRAMTDQNQILGSQSISAVAGAIESERNTRAQLQIAQKQAQAAQDSVAILQEQMRLDQRAWIGPTNEVKSIFMAGQRGLFSVVLKNSGKTPALHLHNLAHSKTLDKGENIEFTYHSSTPPELSETTIQPQAEFTLNIWGIGPINQKQIDNMHAGIWVTYTYGKIDYRDIFGELHHTTFCYYVNDPSMIAHACAKYNNAD